MNASSMPSVLEPSSLTLVLGGTRSGKSLFAEQLVSQCGSHILYIATADASQNDPSMDRRIALHQQRRPPSWKTLEAPRDIAQHVVRLPELSSFHGILLDCVTLWISNLLFSGVDGSPLDQASFEALIHKEITDLTGMVSQMPCPWVLVSGETGLGGTHPTAIERQFADGLGLANQLLSQAAQRAWFVVASRPLLLPPPFQSPTALV